MWVTHNMAVLNGPTATCLHPSGRLFVLVTNYSKDKIVGCVKLWDEQGRPIFYSQYDKHGHRDGVLCYCQDGVLCLIQEIRQGQAAATRSAIPGEVDGGRPPNPPG